MQIWRICETRFFAVCKSKTTPETARFEAVYYSILYRITTDKSAKNEWYGTLAMVFSLLFELKNGGVLSGGAPACGASGFAAGPSGFD